VLGRSLVSPGGMGRASARHAGSRIGGNTQTQTLTEIIDSGIRGVDAAYGTPLHGRFESSNLRPPVHQRPFFFDPLRFL
jgi:hypothetical protein